MNPAAESPCYVPIRAAMDVIGGKWSYFVIVQLFQGPQRFNQLRRSLGEVSIKSLTDTLRHLEQNGIVHREVFPTVPVSVEYSLTESGWEYSGVLLRMREWGERWSAGAATPH
ncbi:winged helix-turn-helix transcriptional regulator [Paenibacillus thalictri]|uniref:Transcriptional regulator n=1 Tax=Paenibacillus thalictri TaxID=2527873 RepID=A0A4Q9DT01_9BACL|nr:helix-turn-helix domain-containing protein [Paenibacillus thalictri]TBL78629.1 transcriptional regulator [Paenibacillus thalictri]